jgi:hypothetical protein
MDIEASSSEILQWFRHGLHVFLPTKAPVYTIVSALSPTMTPTHNSNVQLLATLVDFSDDYESEYRFLVDGKHVKYVTVDPGVLPRDGRTFAPILLPMLPPFPPGDWNEGGHISKDCLSGHPVFSRYTRSDLPGISNTWHHTRIDHLELKKLDSLRPRALAR